MHVLIVNFALRGLDPEGYRQHCEQVAPTFAALLGLISKMWLANSGRIARGSAEAAPQTGYRQREYARTATETR